MFAGDLNTGISFGGGVLVPGRWGHVAFAIDAAGSAKLFVDGSEVGSGSFRGEGCAPLPVLPVLRASARVARGVSSFAINLHPLPLSFVFICARSYIECLARQDRACCLRIAICCWEGLSKAKTP